MHPGDFVAASNAGTVDEYVWNRAPTGDFCQCLLHACSFRFAIELYGPEGRVELCQQLLRSGAVSAGGLREDDHFRRRDEL
eukprot:CAMPEP_0198242660 /NCGR_PEP_ID=MMETSP1446-20131203/19168_1 /TAXON_ID=1461542 ORGANISM="Unidentified sp, Strain CCMP2111" /NCGR_SAMPLE_ID=MMETSP1446 /ASSEMBLY_ACC=CAM_ASM_001112 /LENGTH=80 /DNA_ID=CAMNT_0043926221 /DNA_START=171 /DNA_END=410 /DNA_ORIENTATION=-